MQHGFCIPNNDLLNTWKGFIDDGCFLRVSLGYIGAAAIVYLCLNLNLNLLFIPVTRAAHYSAIVQQESFFFPKPEARKEAATGTGEVRWRGKSARVFFNSTRKNGRQSRRHAPNFVSGFVSHMK